MPQSTLYLNRCEQEIYLHKPLHSNSNHSPDWSTIWNQGAHNYSSQPRSGKLSQCTENYVANTHVELHLSFHFCTDLVTKPNEDYSESI